MILTVHGFIRNRRRLNKSTDMLLKATPKNSKKENKSEGHSAGLIDLIPSIVRFRSKARITLKTATTGKIDKGSSCLTK